MICKHLHFIHWWANIPAFILSNSRPLDFQQPCNVLLCFFAIFSHCFQADRKHVQNIISFIFELYAISNGYVNKNASNKCFLK